MRWLRIFVKTSTSLIWLARFIIVGQLSAIFIRDSKKLHLFRIRLVSYTAQKLLNSLHISVKYIGHPELLTGEGNHLIIANHLSYIDIMAVAASLPCAFITSVEVRDAWFEGIIAKSGGSLFVERRNPRGLPDEIEFLAKTLSEGIPIAIFPEGGTTNGEQMKPFKRSLLEAAVQAKVDIIPVVINYLTANKKPIDETTRDSVFYYGKMKIIPHIVRLLSLIEITLEVKVLDRIRVDEASSGRDLADTAFEKVSSEYRPILKNG